MISLLILTDLFPACFSCENNFNLSQSSLTLNGKINVLETPEAIILGDSSNFVTDLSLSLFRPFC